MSFNHRHHRCSDHPDHQRQSRAILMITKLRPSSRRSLSSESYSSSDTTPEGVQISYYNRFYTYQQVIWTGNIILIDTSWPMPIFYWLRLVVVQLRPTDDDWTNWQNTAGQWHFANHLWLSVFLQNYNWQCHLVCGLWHWQLGIVLCMIWHAIGVWVLLCTTWRLYGV